MITSVEHQVRAFILDHFYVTDPDSLTNDSSLIESGLIDSTGIMGVILFIESEFGIEVSDRDTVPENFESIAQIAAFVGRKRGTVDPA